MKKLLMLLTLASFCGSLTACNTMAGVGKDVERGGEHVQDAAHSVQQDMRNH